MRKARGFPFAFHRIGKSIKACGYFTPRHFDVHVFLNILILVQHDLVVHVTREVFSVEASYEEVRVMHMGEK